MSEFGAGPVRHYALFHVSDGYGSALEKKSFYNRAHAAFETARVEKFNPALWGYDFGLLRDTDLDLPGNAELTDFFGSPRYFAVIVDRGNLDDYRQRLTAHAAERNVSVELEAIYSYTFASKSWSLEWRKPAQK